MLEIAQGVTAIGVILAIAWFWSTLVHPLLARMLTLVWRSIAVGVSWVLVQVGLPLARAIMSGASALATAVTPARKEPAAPPVVEGTAEGPRERADGVAEPLSRERQWERVSGVVKDAAARVEAIQVLQRSAEQQLDAATYAVQRLFNDLAVIMTVPVQAAEAPQSEPSVVLKLNPVAIPAKTADALAA